MKTIVLTLKKGKSREKGAFHYGRSYKDNVLGAKKIVIFEQRIRYTERMTEWREKVDGIRYEYEYLAIVDGELDMIMEGDLWDITWAYDVQIEN